MTDNSSSAVGRAAIDAYLDSVEMALLAVNAPRIDRMQVLQDLEAQIDDMMAQQPTPLTEESVRSVLNKLEPPSHFGATYGNDKQAVPTPAPGYFAQLPRVPWPIVASASCALLAMACLFAVFAAAANQRDLFELMIFLAIMSFVFTPIPLWMAYRQLRVQPDAPGRDLVLKSTTVYVALAVALLVLIMAAMTEGFVLAALGFVAFVYLETMLIRRIWRHMSEALTPQPTSLPTRDTNGNGASAPVASGAPMPAV